MLDIAVMAAELAVAVAVSHKAITTVVAYTFVVSLAVNQFLVLFPPFSATGIRAEQLHFASLNLLYRQIAAFTKV